MCNLQSAERARTRRPPAARARARLLGSRSAWRRSWGAAGSCCQTHRPRAAACVVASLLDACVCKAGDTCLEYLNATATASNSCCMHVAGKCCQRPGASPVYKLHPEACHQTRPRPGHIGSVGLSSRQGDCSPGNCCYHAEGSIATAAAAAALEVWRESPQAPKLTLRSKKLYSGMRRLRPMPFTVTMTSPVCRGEGASVPFCFRSKLSESRDVRGTRWQQQAAAKHA